MAYVKAVASSISNEDTGVLGPGFTTLDGVMLSNNDPILLTRQTTKSENGVWVWHAAGTQLSRPLVDEQFRNNTNLDNATIVWVTGGTARAGTVWGIDPGKRVTVDTTDFDLTRVSLSAVQARVATTANITLANTFLTIDGTTVTDGAITNGTGTLTCATSKPFKSSDEGKRIIVTGAGAGATDLVALITGYSSASVVTVTPTAGTTVADATVEFGVAIVGDGTAGSDIVVVKDQDDASENGFYWAKTTGAMQPSTEPLTPGRNVLVSEGARNAHTRFAIVNQAPIAFGTTDVRFSPQSLVYNVRDFGALGDATTNDLPAFEAAIAAMNADPRKGAVLYIPPGTYLLNGDLHLVRQVIVRGDGVGGGLSGEGASILVFPAGSGLICDAAGPDPEGPRGDYSIIEQLDIKSTPLELAEWVATNEVTVGDLVQGVDDNRYYFECTVGGTTDDSYPFGGLHTPAVTGKIGITVEDGGTVRWVVRAHAGITMKSRAQVQHVYINGFTNAGVLVAAPYGDEDPGGAANGWQLAHVSIIDCGMGVFVDGQDTNGGAALDVTIHNIGDHITGTGGHGVHDRSAFGCLWMGCVVHKTSGHSYLTDDVEAGNRFAVFLNCYTEDEETHLPPKIATAGVFIGAGAAVIDADSAGLILTPGWSRNICFSDAAQETKGGLDLAGTPRVMWFRHATDAEPFAYWRGVGRTGEWSFGYGSREAHSFLGEEAVDVKGNWRDVHGHYLGINNTEHVFVGPASARTDKYVRGGRYLVGDHFWLKESAQAGVFGQAGTFLGRTVREDGFRGFPWEAAKTYAADADAAVADMVEVATYGTEEADEPVAGLVYRCTHDGVSSGTEPTWGSAVNDGDPVDEVPGDDTRWERVGSVALYNRIGEVTQRMSVVTGGATATLLGAYLTAANTLSTITVTVTAACDDAKGASYVRVGAWVNAGVGADLLGAVADVVTIETDAGWDVTFVETGEYVQVWVTGAAMTSIRWTANLTAVCSKFP